MGYDRNANINHRHGEEHNIFLLSKEILLI
jgi:hypothetical protein